MADRNRELEARTGAELVDSPTRLLRQFEGVSVQPDGDPQRVSQDLRISLTHRLIIPSSPSSRSSWRDADQARVSAFNNSHVVLEREPRPGRLRSLLVWACFAIP